MTKPVGYYGVPKLWRLFRNWLLPLEKISRIWPVPVSIPLDYYCCFSVVLHGVNNYSLSVWREVCYLCLFRAVGSYKPNCVMHDLWSEQTEYLILFLIDGGFNGELNLIYWREVEFNSGISILFKPPDYIKESCCRISACLASIAESCVFRDMLAAFFCLDWVAFKTSYWCLVSLVLFTMLPCLKISDKILVLVFGSEDSFRRPWLSIRRTPCSIRMFWVMFSFFLGSFDLMTRSGTLISFLKLSRSTCAPSYYSGYVRSCYYCTCYYTYYWI